MMAKKAKQESQAEQSERFEKFVQELVDAGELNPTDADRMMDHALSRLVNAVDRSQG